jgi:hypothetical protein
VSRRKEERKTNQKSKFVVAIVISLAHKHTSIQKKNKQANRVYEINATGWLARRPII